MREISKEFTQTQRQVIALLDSIALHKNSQEMKDFLSRLRWGTNM
jgi:hypothetical protein